MLSIIIPTLNEEKLLPVLLKAIRKQDFSDYEIIIADACSEDKTKEIARSFNCRIAKGGAVAKGRNEGAKIAKGDILLFMDADNVYLPPGFLKTLLSEFNKRKLSVASFPLCPDGNIADKILYAIYNWWTKVTQGFLPHATNAVLATKEIHKIIGGFDEEIRIGEDHVYVRDASKHGKFGFIKTKTVLTSCRRFEKEGRFKTYAKYILAGIHMLFVGRIKSDIYKYRYNEYKE